MKVTWLFFWALSMEAASLAPLTLSVPPAFEENRGQAPEAFRYMLSHVNMGFACNAIFGRYPTLPNTVPVRIEFAGANANCTAQTMEGDGTYSHYYRGAAKDGSYERVQRYQRLRFTEVWPGISLEYAASADRITATFQLRAAADLRTIRLTSQNIFPVSNGIGSQLGVWKISASQAAGVAVTAQSDAMGLRFNAPEADATTAMTLTIEIPVAVDVASPRWASSARTTVAADGGWYVAGSTTAFSELDDRSVTCIEFSLTNRCPDAFVAAFDEKGTLRYLVYLLGTRHEQVTALSADPGGNVYVAGATYSPDFVTTTGVLQPQYRGPEIMRSVARAYQGGDGFLVKLHGPTGNIIWSTLIGTEEEDSIRNLSADRNGRTYFTVLSASENLPLQGASASSDVSCCQRVMSISEDGSQIRYSLALSYQEMQVSPTGAVFLMRMEGRPEVAVPQVLALNDDGTLRYRRVIQLQANRFPASIAVSGDAVSGEDSVWLAAAVREPVLQRPLGWELHRIGAGGELSIVTRDIVPFGVALKSDGRGGIWLSTSSLDPIGITPNAVLGYRCESCGALLRIDASGAVRYATYIPYTAYWMEVAAGRLLLRPAYMQPGQADIYVLDEEAPAVPLLASVSDTSSASGTLQPGNVINLVGAGIGPGSIVEWPRGADGLAATEVEGVQVMIDGTAARILAARSDRITVMVPINRASFDSGKVRILHYGIPVASVTLLSSAQRYSVLTGVNAPLGFAIRNEDGSVNSAESPAPRGSVIQFFVASMGPTDPPLVEGEFTHGVLAKPQPAVNVHFGIGSPRAELLNFAQAPDYVSGIFEVRVRLPQSVPEGITRLPIVFNEDGRDIFHWQVPQVNVR